MANTYLQRTQATGNRRKHTLSLWVKKSKNETTLNIFTAYNASTDFTELKFNNVDQLQFQNKVGNNWSGELKTNRVFRDTSAWYHIVIVWDSENTNSAAQRMRMYINGVEESSFATRQNPSNPTDSNIGESGVPIRFGAFNSSEYFNGIMSHVHFSDGYVYDASTFGETDSTTGEWKIKTSPSFTLGTTGYSILKDGNTITDQSTNSNNFSLGGGTLTKTEDNPSNVFDTLNANISQTADVAGRDSDARPFLEYANTVSSTDVAIWTPQMGSIPITSGKYYFEMKRTYVGSPSNHLAWVGIESTDTAGTTLGSPSGFNTNAIAYYSAGSVNKSNVSQSGSWSTWQSNNDIVQVAIDLDNYFIYFGKNGVWQNSGNPESGGSGTGGIAIVASQSYISACTVHRGGGSSGGSKTSVQLNYGNGYFAQNAISSAGTNASGNGIFEYNVPAGFTAISTKGLNL